MKRFSIAFLALLLSGLSACHQPEAKLQAEVRTVDSLNKVLSSFSQQIELLPASNINTVLERARLQINSGYWDNNPAAIQSLHKAEEFLNGLETQLLDISQQLKNAQSEATEFVRSPYNYKVEQSRQVPFVFHLSELTSALGEQTDYLFSRYNVQVLLLETLEYDRAKSH